MSKLDMNKMLVEATLSKALKDLKADPDKALRSWMEKSEKNAKGREPNEVLARVRELLRDPGSAYYTLVKRMVKQVQADRLKTFGLNLGYHGLTAGQQALRSKELLHDVHIPWSISFDLDGTVTASQIDSIIEQGKALGIYCYQLHCRTEKRVYDLPPLLTKHKEAAFILYTRPQVVTDVFLEHFEKHKHVLLSLACQEGHEDEKFDLLQKAGFLYAAHFDYNGGNVGELYSGRFLHYAESVGAIAAMAWPQEGVPVSLRDEVYRYLCFQRKEQRQAVLPIEVVEDSILVDQLLSKERGFLSFNGAGQRISWEKGCVSHEGNISRETLLQILARPE